MEIISLVKIFAAIAGVALFFWFLLVGLVKKDKRQLGKAVKILAIVAGLLVLLTAVEFIYAYAT